MEQTQSIYGPYVFEISILYETAYEMTTNSSPTQHDCKLLSVFFWRNLNGLLN